MITMGKENTAGRDAGERLLVSQHGLAPVCGHCREAPHQRASCFQGQLERAPMISRQ